MAEERETAASIVWLLGPIKVKAKDDKIVFTFAGRTTGGEVRKLSLIYHAHTRLFGASNGAAPNEGQWRKLQQPGDLFGLGREVNGSGKLRDLLKSQLTPEQVARCVALSLTHGRK
ncbi:protein of unknown function [Pseudorhizobium banfieldiae]|uniref:Uncharacterized protein n=1 Tax=Pseudorhizobium banfieldiae TaxID=1125847 RepID=L0NE46_9HYPH|nr:hypothetical protein [Pseudorhizobium banfieldiae]CAD6606114.1 hypothetical protein RNT25_01788 [arsenite-oxidising bacterium NT-25]CCF19134.1 protein of unknown function [Pseudorhizobium banfieldiae]